MSDRQSTKDMRKRVQTIVFGWLPRCSRPRWRRGDQQASFRNHRENHIDTLRPDIVQITTQRYTPGKLGGLHAPVGAYFEGFSPADNLPSGASPRNF